MSRCQLLFQDVNGFSVVGMRTGLFRHIGYIEPAHFIERLVHAIPMNLRDFLISIRRYRTHGHICKNQRAVLLYQCPLFTDSTRPRCVSFGIRFEPRISLNVITTRSQEIPNHLEVCVHRKVNRSRRSKLRFLYQLVLFHECGKHIEQVVYVRTEIIIIRRKLIAYRKIDNGIVRIRLYTDKTVSFVILIDVAAFSNILL